MSLLTSADGSLGALLRRRAWKVTGVGTVVGAVLVSRLGLGWAALVYVPLLAGLGPVLAVVDLEVLRLPNALVLPAVPVEFAVLGVASAAQGDGAGLVRAVTAAVVAAVALGVLAVASQGGFGWGDVKLVAGLLAPALAWSSWWSVLIAAWVAFGTAAVGGAVLRLRVLAFGPFLLAGAMVATLWRGTGG